MEILDQDKSATIKSTNTVYNTPPESPVMPHPLFKTIGESLDKPPVAPPRYKRKTKETPTPNRISPSLNPIVAAAHQDSSSDVLEKVAHDLIRMGDEIDQRLSFNENCAKIDDAAVAKVAAFDASKDDQHLKGRLLHDLRASTNREKEMRKLSAL